ncbi:MAG TPA: RNA polymerase sigma-70 factor [Chryseolinea sp.]|nr:RNA polymerase sigma-70 factor [Chryseolinea sp.]
MDHVNCSDQDNDLLLRLRQGDNAAFTLIYKSYSMKLYAVAFASLRSDETAREVVQEIFISLWINRQKIVVHQSVLAYLLGAVRFKVFNIIDKECVRSRYKKEFLQTLNLGENVTEQIVNYNELKLAIERQIDSLPETTKNVFVMSRFQGMNNNEIAGHIHLSSKAVEYHLSKALKVLRLHLRHMIYLFTAWISTN